MKKIDIKKVYEDIDSYKDKKIKFGGWVRSVRDLKKFGFITLTDGSTIKTAQVVIDCEMKGFDECVKLLPGSTVICEGIIISTPEAKQSFEMKAEKVEILSKTDETYPLQKKGSSFEFLREHTYLRGRTTTFQAVYKIRSEAVLAVHKFFEQEGFTHVHTPILTTSDCEGGCELYKVSSQDIYSSKQLKPEDELLGKQVFLTPTGQLQGEALAMGLGKVYTFGPTFRAEDSRTTRHLTEFWHVEPEMAFYDLDDSMELMEQMIKYIIKYVLEKCYDELLFCDSFIEKGLIQRLKSTLTKPFAKVSYTKAIELLMPYQSEFDYVVKWGEDLHTEQERFLSEKIFKQPVFVYDYPKDFKAFYMKIGKDGKTCRATDLLVAGIGELCGAGERECDLDILKSRIKELGLKEQDYWWYLKLREYGSVPHSGFGMGFDRLIMFLTGMKSIKDVIPFPRTPKSCEF